MGILDAYKADVEANPNTDCTIPETSGIGEDQKEEFKVALEGMRKRIDEYDRHGTIDGGKVVIKESDANESDPYEGYINKDELMSAFLSEYPRTNESSLSLRIGKVVPMVKQAYCPKCGKEIVNTAPIVFNPFTMESICKYDCECGWKANLEYAYPRVVFVTEDGMEINAYAK